MSRHHEAAPTARALCAAAALCALLLAALPARAAVRAPPVIGGTVDLFTAGRTYGGAVSGDRAGRAVALIADSDGDGRVDAAVGSPGAGGGRGLVRVVAAGVEPVDRGATAVTHIVGAAPDSRAGSALAPIGDLDGDGLGDLVVGAPGETVAGRGRAGAVYVVYGASGVGPVRLDAVGARVSRVLGARAGDRTGGAVASVPDANGDGRPELAIGARDADGPHGVDAGRVVVIFSGALLRGATVDLAQPLSGGVAVEGPRAGAHAGAAVAGSPDIDGDRRGELLVGAPGAGRRAAGAAYVVALPGTAAALDLAARDPRVLTLRGAAGEQAGSAVAGIGDVTGDPHPDVLVGAPRAGRGSRRHAGAVYVVAGSGSSGAVSLARTPGYAIAGADRGDLLGRTTVAAGDVNGDRIPDLLLGAPGARPLNRPGAGAAYVVLGDRSSAGPLELGLLGNRGVRLAGRTPGGRTGLALAGGADVDGDRLADVITGTPGTTRGGSATVVASPRPPAMPRPAAGCTPVDTAVVIDDSKSMAAADPLGLRADALTLLLEKPSSGGRAISTIEAAEQPAEVLPPVPVPVDGLPPDSERTVTRLIEEALTGDGGRALLAPALEAAAEQSPRAKQQIMITDDSGAVGTTEAPPIARDVIALDGRAGTTGSTVAVADLASDPTRFVGAVPAADLAAQLVRLDAAHSCATPLGQQVAGLAPTPADQLPAAVELTPEQPSADVEFETTTADAVEIVLTWDDPDVPVEVGPVEVESDKGTARVSTETLQHALDGEPATEDGVTVAGRRGRSYVTFELRFDSGLARTAAIIPRKIHSHTRSPSKKAIRARTQALRRK